MGTRSVSSTVDEDLFQRARDMTGAGQAETIRQALQHFVATGPGATPAAVPAMAPAMAAPTAAPAGAKPVADMTGDEKRASLKLLIKARQALSDSIVSLTGEHVVADSDEKGRLRILIGDVEADLAKVNARITAFQAGQLTMVPPSAATVDKISELAEEVGELAMKAQQTDLVVAAVKQVVQIWTGTQA